MICEGEALVELKERIPSEGLGPTIASFANTLGGWVILGVEDDPREVVGWKPKGRADALDYLRDLLAREVDPLPPFGARRVRVGRRYVVVVRIYESADTPHIVRGSGSVYVREPGRKRPIQRHDELIELARRGEAADERAREDLTGLPAVVDALHVDAYERLMLAGKGIAPSRDIQVVARAAPLTVTPTMRDWPLTRDAAQWCLERVEDLLPPFGPPYGREGPWSITYGRAMAARLRQAKGGGGVDEATVVVDSGGVVGGEIRRGPVGKDEEAVILINAMLDDELLPLARLLADTLARAEAYGRAIVELELDIPSGARIAGGTRTPDGLHVGRELTIPAEPGDVEALAQSWHRELQRELGIPKFEE